MTLRITAEIVPFGDESRKYTIGVINISNIGARNFPLYEYIVNYHDAESGKVEAWPNVLHRRNRGWIRLLRQVLINYNNCGKLSPSDTKLRDERIAEKLAAKFGQSEEDSEGDKAEIRGDSTP